MSLLRPRLAVSPALSKGDITTLDQPIRGMPRPADRNIAELAGGTGEYRPSQHRAIAEAGGVRVPGGDYDAYVESHVRRLEALRRAGIVERVDADR